MKRVLFIAVIVIIAIALFLLFRGTGGSNTPAATPTVQQGILGNPVTPIPGATETESSSGSTDTEILPGTPSNMSELTCYYIGDGDWPLKVLSRHGQSTTSGNGPYTVIYARGGYRVFPDWGYIGTVHSGDQLCINQ